MDLPVSPLHTQLTLPLEGRCRSECSAAPLRPLCPLTVPGKFGMSMSLRYRLEPIKGMLLD